MKTFTSSANRLAKAKKIESVLCDFLDSDEIEGNRILDLGCGSGHIAEYFSHSNEVIASDVVYQITVNGREGFKFRRIETSKLPFQANSFDIVIFNNVIVAIADQLGEMKEIARVLKKDGICYFASPNRYFPIESITKLPLVHYLPNILFRTLYKKIYNTNEDYFLLGYYEMIDLFRRSGFEFFDYTTEIIQDPGKYNSEYRILFNLPIPGCISPTNIFVLSLPEK